MTGALRTWPLVGEETRVLLDKGGEAEDDLRFREALKYCEEALALEPDNPTCIGAVAGVLVRLGHWDRVVELDRRLLAVYPDDAGMWQSLGNVLLSFLHKPGEAAEAYRRATEIDGTQLAHHLGLIQSLSAAGAHDEAIAHAERVLGNQLIQQRAGERAFLYEGYGDALYLRGRKHDAAKAYRKALDLLPPGDPARGAELDRKARKATQAAG